jgi:hypothetical protein
MEQLDDIQWAWDTFSYNGRLQWFAKGRGRVHGGRTSTYDGLGRLIAWSGRQKIDLYLGLNPARPCGVKARSRDILFTRYFFIDLDPIGEPTEAEAKDAAAVVLAARGVEGLEGIEGAAVVYSGRGVQFFLTLYEDGTNSLGHAVPRSVWATEAAISRALRDLGARISPLRTHATCHGDGVGGGIPSQSGGVQHTTGPKLSTWRIDPAVSDAARIIRCPGSINTKTGRQAKVWQPEVGTLKGPLPEVEAQAHQAKAIDKELTNLRDMLPHLTLTARNYLLRGVREPGRHAAAVATARNLHRELALPPERVEEMVVKAAEHQRPPLSESDARRIVMEELKWRPQ